MLTESEKLSLMEHFVSHYLINTTLGLESADNYDLLPQQSELIKKLSNLSGVSSIDRCIIYLNSHKLSTEEAINSFSKWYEKSNKE